MSTDRPRWPSAGPVTSRRAVLVAAAAAALTACHATTGARRAAASSSPAPSSSAPSSASPSASPSPVVRTVSPAEPPTATVPAASLTPDVVAAQLQRLTPPPLTTVPAPVLRGTLTDLPGADAGNGLALTVDDGIDPTVVAAYLAFIETTGIPVTFFVNGANASWTEHRDRLRPLVEAGTVQLGNHTWSHPDLTKQSDHEVADQLQRNHDFLVNTYGVDARPFYRPPFGFHSARVDRIAAGLGYSTTTMWYGSLGDAAVLTETVLLAQAEKWIGPGKLVIGHANHPTVTHVFPEIVAYIEQRGLHPVTLEQVWKRA